MITYKLPAQVVSSSISTPGAHHLTVTLSYDPDTDPLTVKMDFRTPWDDDEDAIVWLVGRHLFARGLSSRHVVGKGDVKLLRRSNTTLLVCLRSPTGHADIEIPFDGASEFLVETLEVVPLGSESLGTAVDDFIQEVLGA